MAADLVRDRDPEQTRTARGSSHHPLKPWCAATNTAATVTTTPTAMRQSSPTMKSYQNRPNCASHFMTAATSATRCGSTRERRRAPNDSDDHERDERRAATRRAPGHSTPAPSALQKIPNEVSITPTPNFNVFSGTRVSGACTITPAINTTTSAAAAPSRGQPDVALRAAERHDDERDLEALEEHALERDGERVPVVRAAARRARAAARPRPRRSLPRRASPSSRSPAGSPCAATATRTPTRPCRRRAAASRSAGSPTRGRARRRSRSSRRARPRRPSPPIASPA